MRNIGRTTWASFAVVLLGLLLFAVGTDGFRAYTAEAARIIKLNGEHPEFPKIVLQDSTGRSFTLSELSGKYVLMTFIYTSCGTVCPQLEMNMAEIYDRLPDDAIGQDIVFLSVSFDTDRDTPEALEAYRHYFVDDPDNWRLARVPDRGELNKLLESFGVIVIPGNNGDFAHNGAFYLIDRHSRLAEIMNDTKIDQAVDKIARRLARDKEA